MLTTVHTGKLFRVIHETVQLGEKIKIFESVERAPGVRIFFQKNEKILLSRERRRELDIYDYRLPGGKVFDRLEDYILFLGSNKNILDEVKKTTIKEGKEETGITIVETDIIYKDTLGATVHRDLYYVAATVFDDTDMQQELGAGEDISIGRYSKEEVLEIMKTGQMSESRTRAFLYNHLGTL